MTIKETIEVRCVIMTEAGFSSVGAVPMDSLCRDPISIAAALWKHQDLGMDAAARQPPVALLGEHAQAFGVSTGLKTITKQESKGMVTEDQLERFYRYLGILKHTLDKSDAFHDTAGAVVIATCPREHGQWRFFRWDLFKEMRQDRRSCYSWLWIMGFWNRYCKDLNEYIRHRRRNHENTDGLENV